MRGLELMKSLALSSRAEMAVKSALAVALSWVAAEAVTQIYGDLENYLYYAPLGAVTATYPTLAAAARTAGSTVLALALGAALGLVVHQATAPGPLSLALVVGIGVTLGAVPGLGDQRSWVPIVALFVLAIGGNHALMYAGTYVGLTGLGALCGVAVNLLLPGMPLRQGRDAVERLRAILAGQLAEVATGLRDRTPPGRQAWQRRRSELDAAVQRTRQAVREVLQAQRGNPRAPFHRTDVRRQDGEAEVLERVAILIHDLMGILNETHRKDLESTPLDAGLATVIADALDRLGDLIRVYAVEIPDDDPRVQAVQEATERLTAEFDRRRNLDADDMAILGAVVVNLRWSLAVVRGE